MLVPPLELESNVSLWLSAVSQYRARVTFCSYSVMEMCTKGLGAQTGVLRMKGVNLSCVRTCMVVAEERPRIALTQSFSKLFKDLGLPARAVSTTFGCRVNVAICLQGTAGPDPTTVYVDMRALRHDRVRLVERGSPHSLPLTESGKILPGVKVIIAHTETKGPLGDSHLGEVRRGAQSPVTSPAAPSRHPRLCPRQFSGVLGPRAGHLSSVGTGWLRLQSSPGGGAAGRTLGAGVPSVLGMPAPRAVPCDSMLCM